MILGIIQYYWPRLLLGVWFALTNSIIVAKRFGKKHFVSNVIIMFFIACTTISIACEYFSRFMYYSYLADVLPTDSQDLRVIVDILLKIAVEAAAFVLPIIIFSKLIKEKWKVAATVYFMYVLLDDLCMILAVSAISYLLIWVSILGIAIVFFLNKLKFVIKHAKVIEWDPVFHYQLGLFFLLSALYGVYRVFPGINNGVFDSKNIWLDTISIVSFMFYLGFVGMNIRVCKERAEKILYMQELHESERDIIQKLSEISEAKSGETGQHVRRVAEYSALLAKEYGFDENIVNQVRLASMMHDVGKLLVPREIIEKPGILNDDEMQIMRLHTRYGDEILSNSNGEEIVMARTIAKQHHERWDGLGYPDGLFKNQISIYAQIVAVADVYDALTSKRAYKESWDAQRARAEILAQSGTQFSPIVVGLFNKHFDKILEIQNTYVDDKHF